LIWLILFFTGCHLPRDTGWPLLSLGPSPIWISLKIKSSAFTPFWLALASADLITFKINSDALFLIKGSFSKAFIGVIFLITSTTGLIFLGLSIKYFCSDLNSI
jgi:hypothetical protein